MPEKTTILSLKKPLLNADGSIVKDGSTDARTQEELTKLTLNQRMETWPPLTMGNALLGLINNKKNLENIEEMAKLQRLLVKIRNKLQTGKGEWVIEKQELLDLKQVFDKMDTKLLQVSIHGQIYNKIQDLLIKVTE